VAFTKGRYQEGDFWRKLIRALSASQARTRVSSPAIRRAGAGPCDLARYKTLAEQNSDRAGTIRGSNYIVQQDESTVKLDQALIDKQKPERHLLPYRFPR